MTNTDVKLLLARWALWSKDGSTRALAVNLGYKSIWDSLLPCGGNSGSSREVDTEMLKIDGAMAWIKEHSELDFRLLKLKYYDGDSFQRISKKLSRELPKYQQSKTLMCDKHAKNLVELAEQTLAGYLCKSPSLNTGA